MNFVFPQDEVNETIPDKFQRHGGLELRDYFAAQALPAAIALAKGGTVDEAMTNAAALAYKQADACMAFRRLQKIDSQKDAA